MASKKHPLPNSKNNTDAFPAKINAVKIRASNDPENSQRARHEQSLAKLERLADRNSR